MTSLLMAQDKRSSFVTDPFLHAVDQLWELKDPFVVWLVLGQAFHAPTFTQLPLLVWQSQTCCQPLHSMDLSFPASCGSMCLV